MDARTDGDAHDPTDLLEHYRRRSLPRRSAWASRKTRVDAAEQSASLMASVAISPLAGDGLRKRVDQRRWRQCQSRHTGSGRQCAQFARYPCRTKRGRQHCGRFGRHGHRSALGRPPRLTPCLGELRRRRRIVLRQPGGPSRRTEQTPFGAFETRTSESGSEHQVVETYTPKPTARPRYRSTARGLLDRASYQIAIWGIDLPFTTLSTTYRCPLHATMTAPPAVDEATAGQIVFGPTDMTTAATG